MGVLSLKVRISDTGVCKTMQFDPSTLVYDACKIIREKMPEANLGQPKDYGLFLADEDPKKGVWMENGRSLEYYLVRSGDLLEYKKKVRTLRVRMLDNAVKTLMVDDSQPVGQLMVVICTRIGITNHEEYSMVRDIPVEKEERMGTLKKEEKSLAGTLTLGRSKEKKMEALRRALHTDEELNWVDHSKTLREQGIEENETLLLRRKYFFSDQNVDSRDPVQLNLLYVQCRDGVMDGSHPVSKEEAFFLAGLQCQIQFGDHVDTKHKYGFLDLREFLPKEYIKSRDAEKRVLAEYKSNRGAGELDAKVRYVSKCRSLKTYGVTFFLVKEKMKGKNKLVPRLLGINKDCVMRVDEKTKEVLRVWPLEQVRRWAASPNTFTLDFGDYQDAYYSVQTTDGEKIAQLIAGYIDIILKKKRAKDHFGIEGDEGSTMLEDTVSPAKATLMSHGMISKGHAEEGNIALPGVMRAGANGELPYSAGSMQNAQYGAVEGQITSVHPPPGQKPKMYDTMSKSQRALIGTIEASVKAVERAEEELDTKADLPPLGEDPASKAWVDRTMAVQKQYVGDQLAAMGAATAHVVQLTGHVPDKVDHTAVGAAISTISSNLPDMTKGVKTIAALMEEEDQSDHLLVATKKLCGAFSDFLTAVNPDHDESPHENGVSQKPPLCQKWESKETRQTVLAAAGRVGDYSHEIVQEIKEPTDESKEFQDILVQLAKSVASSTAQLVLKAKNVSGSCEDQGLQDKVIHSATQCAFATSQLVACARVVAPTIDSPSCQEQLTDAAKQVAKAVEQLLKDAETACQDPKSLGDLRDAARQVTRALEDLIGHIKTGPAHAHGTQQDQELETIITSTDRIITYEGSANELVKQAKVLAEATTHLVGHIRGEAEQADGGDKDKMMGAARRLADATSKMIDEAKQYTVDPNATEREFALKEAAENVRVATEAASVEQLQRRAIARLEEAARQAAANAAQTIQSVNTAQSSNRNQQIQQELSIHCQDTADLVPRLITAVKKSQKEPQDSYAHIELFRVSTEFLDPALRMSETGRIAVSSVGDPSAGMHLSTCTQKLNESLSELRVALNQVHIQGGARMELDNAIEIVRGLDGELSEFRKAAGNGQLYPLPGETTDGSTVQLATSSKMVGSSMAQLLSAAVQNDEQYVGMSARDATEGLKQLTGGIHGVCATRKDAPSERLIDSGRDVMTKSIELFIEVQNCLHHPGQPENQEKLARVARGVTYSLNSCLNSLPGQQDIESALQSIETMMQNISISNIPPSARSYQEVQDDLLRMASLLSEATSRLAGSAGAPPHILAEAVNHYLHCYKNFFSVAMEMTYHQKDAMVKEQMVEGIRNVSRESIQLLASTQASAADPHSPNLKQQLTTAAKQVTVSINQLIDICMSGAPWQRECDKALRSIQSMRYLLDNPIEPVNHLSYYECLDVVTEKSKNLGDGMTGIAHHAKKSELDAFCVSVRDVAEAVCGLAESAAQAAYLVGVSDPSSTPGKAGLIDNNKFARSIQIARESCMRVRTGQYNQQEVLEDATSIAKHTGTLANMCRDASNRTNNASAKKHFIHCAREVANNTASLIKTIKTLDSDFSGDSRAECAVSADSLLTALDSLSTFVNSPEFASLPARISPAGREAQQPIADSGRHMLDGSCEMIKTAKQLAINPKDPPTWQQLAGHSKTVSDSIKSLVSAIRDRAPGQAECDAAIEHMNELIRSLDQTSLAAINQQLPPRNENSEQGFYELICTSGAQIQERINGVRVASRSEAENLGHRVREIMRYFDPLVDGCVGASSHSYNSKRQMELLDQCKTITECQLTLLYNAKDAGGNPKAVEFHVAVDESGDALRDALGDLLQSAQGAISEAGIVSNMVESISKSIARTDEAIPEGSALSYVDCQTRMIRACNEIKRIASEMVSKSSYDPSSLGPLALELSRQYAQLAEDSREAMAASQSPEVAQRIRSSVQELGKSCIDIVKQAGACRAQPGDEYCKKDLNTGSGIVSQRVDVVLASLQAGSRGTQACINAASTVSGIIGDLDTTIMFATAGTLNPDRDGDHFSDHREAILKTAKALVEDTKALVSGAASSQEQLAVAAQNAVRTICHLSDVVKSGAASLTSKNSEAQVLVIHAVKDVAAALASLIQATKNASGKSFNDPAMSYLKEAAKVMVTNVTSLLKTVKTVEDEHQRGTRALEASIEAIAQEIRAFDSTEVPNKTANPEEILRSSKPLTDATAKVVAAGQSCLQEDVIVAANMARKAVADTLWICKSAAYGAESPDARYKALDAGRDVAIKVRELLQTLHLCLQQGTQESRQSLIPASRAIAQAVTELVAYGEILKGSDWIDPSDPTVIAENELLGAANSIEAAAKKLAQLRPRSAAREADENLNFDEQILEAATSIAAAVQALVKAASAAQRELVSQGRLDPHPSGVSEDFQWSEGLISAARLVAAAVHNLCEAANALVQGHASEEKLISAAKQVAASTAQLLVACKVKADMNSQAMQRLQAAGHAVKTATEHLVRAAKQSIEAEDERTLIINQRMVSGIAQVMDAQEEVLRKERELDEARVKLSAIRKAKYTDRGSHEPSPDAPYYSDF